MYTPLAGAGSPGVRDTIGGRTRRAAGGDSSGWMTGPNRKYAGAYDGITVQSSCSLAGRLCEKNKITNRPSLNDGEQKAPPYGIGTGFEETTKNYNPGYVYLLLL